MLGLKSEDLLRTEKSPQKVGLRVSANSASESASPSEIYWAVLSANSKGSVEPDVVKIPVSRQFSDVCVTAELLLEENVFSVSQTGPGASCPAGGEFQGTWSRLRVPDKGTT